MSCQTADVHSHSLTRREARDIQGDRPTSIWGYHRAFSLTLQIAKYPEALLLWTSSSTNEQAQGVSISGLTQLLLLQRTAVLESMLHHVVSSKKNQNDGHLIRFARPKSPRLHRHACSALENMAEINPTTSNWCCFQAALQHLPKPGAEPALKTKTDRRWLPCLSCNGLSLLAGTMLKQPFQHTASKGMTRGVTNSSCTKQKTPGKSGGQAGLGLEAP